MLAVAGLGCAHRGEPWKLPTQENAQMGGLFFVFVLGYRMGVVGKHFCLWWFSG